MRRGASVGRDARLDRRGWAWVIGGYLTALLIGIGFALWIKSRGDWRDGLPWEREFLLWLYTPLPPALDAVLLIVPWFGTNITLLPILIVCSAWLYIRRHRTDLALHLLTVVLGSWTLSPILKTLFDRPRPELWEHRGQFAWAAYPSGHAITSVAVLFTIAILLHRERGWRWPYLAAAALLAVSLYSRLYLGVHWPTDVIAGVAIGVVWLLATLRVFPARSEGERVVRQV